MNRTLPMNGWYGKVKKNEIESILAKKCKLNMDFFFSTYFHKRQILNCHSCNTNDIDDKNNNTITRTERTNLFFVFCFLLHSPEILET